MNFNQWMNKPLKRAQVLTYRCAIVLFGRNLNMRFRAFRQYRSEINFHQRSIVARKIRAMRRMGPVEKPHFDEATQSYLPEKTLFPHTT